MWRNSDVLALMFLSGLIGISIGAIVIATVVTHKEITSIKKEN